MIGLAFWWTPNIYIVSNWLVLILASLFFLAGFVPLLVSGYKKEIARETRLAAGVGR